MYKVMIVDDEELIREGLKNIIEWEKLGLKIEQTAENGADALYKFKENKVDIIITDINMPIINGIELLKKIKEIDENIKFIILSGYEEFGYAKEAISIGVHSYLLKPIDEEELSQNLKEITQNLNEENKENIEIKKNNIIKNLLNGIPTKEKKKEISKILNIDTVDKIFTASTLVIKNNFGDIEFDDKKIDFLYDDFGNIIVINSFDKVADYSQIKKYYNKILKYLKDTYNYEVFIAIGKIVDNIENLNESIKISSIVKKNILITGFDNCLSEKDIKIDNIYIKNEINEINRLMIENNKKEVEKYINKLLEENKENPQYVYELATKILILCDDLKQNLKQNDNVANLGQSIIKVLNFTDIVSIKKYLKIKTVYILDNMDNEKNKLSPVIKRILKYVDKNYKEDLSLRSLAKEHKINKAYLGQIFTKEVGVKFSDYLNSVRNSVAKDLILNSNKKISDISKEVGYTDKNYFYRKFKKSYGITPVTLRELSNK